MQKFQVTSPPLHQLSDFLPDLLQDLSIGRSQIVLQQLQSTIGDRPSPLVLAVAVRDGQPIAAAIAVHTQPRLEGGSSSGSSPESASATMAHAGALTSIDECDRPAVASALAERLDTLLLERGVGFVQWATDLGSAGLARWCRAMHFEPIAELEYLSGSLDDARATLLAGFSTPSGLKLVPVDWSDEPHALDQFAGLIERTYVETRDCPQLTEFRTARQTLEGYRASPAFAPQHWYRFYDNSTPEGGEIGCAILAIHSSDGSSGEVVELVYMGLAAESRGRGLGNAMLLAAIDQARRSGCERMIMAVDQNNEPARQLYRRAGFDWVLSEAVWAKAIGI